MINENFINGYVQSKGPVLKWDRVGDQAQVDGELDLSGIIDLEALEEKIEQHVRDSVVGPFATRVELRVFLDGGPWLNLPYGYGRIESIKPKAPATIEWPTTPNESQVKE